MTTSERYNVGGVQYARPFKVRRFGHLGLNVDNVTACIDFYGRLLGFQVTDELDVSKVPELADIPELAAMRARLTDPRVVFLSPTSDHHALLIAHKSLGDLFGDSAGFTDVTVNQLSWQVGSMHEVFKSIDYFRARSVEVRRIGRDMPGSNWATYLLDTDGHTVELFYGMEQIGWHRRSKPSKMYYRSFAQIPPLPQMSEANDLVDAGVRGIDVDSGQPVHDLGAGAFDVSGILLPRPFKVTSLGPVALFVSDVSTAERFYVEKMGFVRTEVAEWKGHSCVYLRCGAEHHSLALMPKAMRSALKLNPKTSLASLGLELGSYQQLREAVEFLKSEGAIFTDAFPSELYPGIDYAAHVIDPEGHCLMLYYYMERIGWDGLPRPADQRRKVKAGEWPLEVEPMSDTNAGYPMMGPLG